MSLGFSLRVATEADAEAIAGLATELGYPAEGKIMRARLRRLLSRADCLVVVAEAENGQVGGWLQALSSEVLESGFRVEIMGLVVARGMRRRGVGRLLVKSAEDWAIRLGARTVVVRSNVTRVESHAFYAALGYAQTKTQHVYRRAIR